MLVRSTAFLLLGLVTAAAKQPPSTALLGVITQVQGAVETIGPGVSHLPLASPWQVIKAGVTVHVPKDGSAGIVCSNRRFVRIKGPASWSLSEPACTAGKELTPAEYALIAPQGGRFKVVEGILVLEREIRSGAADDPLAPMVLSPGNTILGSPRPTVSWSRVPSATEYDVRWTGRGAGGKDKQIQAGEAACAEDREGIDRCSLPWPDDRADLLPGEIFFLRVAARRGIAGPWHVSEPIEVRTQTLAEARDLERQLRDLDRLDLQGVARDRARAGLYSERGLYAAAAELYRQALAAEPAPELWVTVADLELVMVLSFPAESRYRSLLAEPQPAVRAAAAFGLGRIAYSRSDYRAAAALFRQARELYAQLGLAEEESAAGKAVETATARAPK